MNVEIAKQLFNIFRCMTFNVIIFIKFVLPKNCTYHTPSYHFLR